MKVWAQAKSILVFVAFFASSQGFANVDQHLQSLDFAIDHAILVRAVSKEVCSCVFVEKQEIPRCWSKLGLPSPVQKLVRIEVVNETEFKGVRVFLTGTAKTLLAGDSSSIAAESRYNHQSPRRGCRLRL